MMNHSAGNQRTKSIAQPRTAALLLTLVGIGCGGGGGGTGVSVGQSTVVPTISISWAARSRAFGGPSSALSAVVTLAGAKPGGGDYTFEIDRSALPGSYTQTYSGSGNAKTGPTQATIAFYAAAGGAGTEVAVAHEALTLSLNNSHVVDVTLIGAVTTVNVVAGQIVTIGTPQQLTFTALDNKGSVVAVSLGSAAWAIASGGANLSLTADGMANGLAIGTPLVTATVDSVVSAQTPVAVQHKPIYSFSVAPITGPGAPPNTTVFPSWINADGDVSGYFFTAGGATTRAFLWKGGSFTLLGPFAAGSNSEAAYVNDSDEVVGAAGPTPISLDVISQGQNAQPACQAFAWKDGQVVFTDSSPTISQGVSVNRSGQILRTIYDLNNSEFGSRTVLRTNGTDQDIPAPYGFYGPVARALNASGAVLGSSFGYASDYFSPFVWQNGLTTPIGGSSPSSMNDLGHFTLYTQGAPSSLVSGLGGSITILYGVYGYLVVNNVDQIVGSASFGEGQGPATIWQNGTATDLNTLIPKNSGWVLDVATCINDGGQVVGYGHLNGVLAAFILTPTS